MTALVFVVGAPLSLYHWLVEHARVRGEQLVFDHRPCTAPWFEKLGFVPVVDALTASC